MSYLDEDKKNKTGEEAEEGKIKPHNILLKTSRWLKTLPVVGVQLRKLKQGKISLTVNTKLYPAAG